MRAALFVFVCVVVCVVAQLPVPLQEFDSDGDGALSDHEFHALFAHFFGLEHDHEEAAPEGSFSAEEEHHHHKIASSNETECPLPDALFAAADANNDTLLADAEITDALAHFAELVVVGCEYTLAESEELPETITGAHWAAAIGSSVIVSIPSLLGVLMIPLGKPWFNRWVMVPLLAFAVGSLVGDSMLHLLPSVFGLHSHGGEADTAAHEHEHEHENEAAHLVEAESFVWKSMLVVVGVLLFFVVEKCVRGLAKRGFHVHGHHHHHEHEKAKTSPAPASNEPADLEAVIELGASSATPDDDDDVAKQKQQQEQQQQLKPMGILALVVDFVHNLIDGVAIGAAFTSGMAAGWATMLAVLFHEVPQELGDVALLARAGFSRKKLVLLNVLVSTSCILGAIIGVAVGSSSESALWAILALTAGGFLYLALADLVPDFVEEGKAVDTVIHVVAMIFGVLVMFAVLFLE